MVEQNNNDLVVEIASLDDSKSVCEHLSTSPDSLTTSEVQQRQSKFGKNVLAKVKTESLFHKFIGNFTSTMAILLWIAGIIAFGAHLVELGIAIWAVNVINGCFSFWQEYQAGKATDALENMLPSYTRVIRDGKEKNLSCRTCPR